ncbi:MULTISPECIES: hypothetical protein [Pseudomonas]|uniref:Uncharacterized protein n=1 Tax=Pseudomonas umsongensis TaxID=198618 RepID=A0ACC5M8U4_9PSED|nr:MULTISPECIES: hypothetical protein [Pseudomonas]MBB2885058.1 hypothetical protein [Pseudomonas umsongensis]NMN74702.1 hypothetical protein [Pseudomonas sp. KD5]
METSRSLMYELVEAAVSQFLIKDATSIRDNISERNLCARLAMQFENLLPTYKLEGYYADPEYNRKQGGQIKTILSGELEVIKVTCDLIVHSRGERGRDNLIAMEMAKPDKTTEQIHSDRLRLMALTKKSFDDTWSYDGVTHPEHVCGYLLGVFMMVDRAQQVVSVEYFEDGKPKANRKKFAVKLT